MLIDQKKVIFDYLEQAYTGAKMADDAEMMCRLSRAIVAFSCDDTENLPTWKQMAEEFAAKQKV